MTELDGLREEVQAIDDEIEVLLLERISITDEIGRIKKKHGLPIENLGIEAKKLASMIPELRSIYREIFKVSKLCQSTIE